MITIISGSHYLALSPIHLPGAPALGGDEVGAGLSGEQTKPLPSDGAERDREISCVPFRSRLGKRGHSGLSRQASRFFQIILVWCSGLSIYISNLMAHKLLAEWFHYSPSVSYKREKRREPQKGTVGVGGSHWTLVNNDAARV